MGKATDIERSDKSKKREAGSPLVFAISVALLKDNDAINVCYFSSALRGSEKPEVHFQRHGHSYGLAIPFARLKQPGPDFFQGLLVQPHAETANHFQVMRLAVGSDDGRERNRSLVLGFAGFLREVRLRGELCHWRSHADVANGVDAAAKSTAFSGTVAGTAAGANAVALA